jgi:tripartite-type tricarboxylate transporter receptor subunit TctC
MMTPSSRPGLRRRLLGTSVAAAALTVARPLLAQVYPVRPVRLIVPYPPGGTTDIVARSFAELMGRELGQQIVVDNRPGAATHIGTDIAMRAAPDGYTLLVGTSGLATNFATGPIPPFDPQKTLTPVSLINQMAYVVCANPAAPFSNVRELLAAARARPGRITLASASLEYVAKLLNAQSGVDILHIPYKGGAAAMTDAISGQVDMAVALVPVMLPQIRAGKLKAIGVSSAQRVGALPDVPSFSESGESRYVVGSWYALHGPANLPRDIVRVLSEASRRVLGNADFLEKQRSIGSDLAWSSPEELANRLRVDTEDALRLARELKLSPNA